MNMVTIQRKWQMFCLNLRICILTGEMKGENGITDRWKDLCRQRDALINKRNSMRTADDLRRIERKRGLL